MSGSNSAERKRYEPLVLVETADLSEEDWLDYRRRGIGGSDVSAIFGTSPFRTARDLYYDKLNIASVEDDEGNWVAHGNGAFAGASGSKDIRAENRISGLPNQKDVPAPTVSLDAG